MNKIFLISLITAAAAFVTDLVISFKTFFRQKKLLIALCRENADLLCKNNRLAAENLSLKCRHEKDLEVVRSANKIVSEDLDAARAEIKTLKLKLAETENKYKNAAAHINVLRIDLNRKQNRNRKNK